MKNTATIALSMLMYRPGRLTCTLLGIGAAFFLTAAQVGLLTGWCNTNTAIIRHASADIWVMARQTPAFDYGTAIPRKRIYQVRSVAGVAWAQGLFMGWNTWSRPDGRGITVEVVGLDDELVGGPWQMHKGPIAAVLRPETVVVDHLYAEALGVARVGEEVEIQGIRAVVGGITEGVRTFTAAPFVFTAIGTAIRFDKRYRDDEVTYVMARCRPGFSPQWVKKQIQLSVPNVEVLTSDDFAVRSAKYWMLETGIGLTIVVTAALGLLVGVFIMSQTLFAITQDNLTSYATLAALGFSLPRLASIILFQGTVLGSGGIAVGGLLFLAAIRASARTTVPLETTTAVFGGLVAAGLTACLSASLTAARPVFRIDPISVFRG